MQAYPTASLITALALVAAGCGAPPSLELPPPGYAGDSSVPVDAPAPAGARSNAPGRAPVSRSPGHRVETRRMFVGQHKSAYFGAGTEVTLESGDRVLAMKRSETGPFELWGMAPGKAVIRTVDRDGDTMKVTIEVVAGARRCKTRDVPVLGLALVDDTNVRMYRSPSNGAGELRLTSTDSVVTFDRPGALLLMTETHDGVSRCTLYQADPDPPVACKTTVSLRAGEQTFIALPKPDSSFAVTGKDTGAVELAPQGLTFVSKKPGRAAAWVRDPKGAWSCTLIEVIPS